ncbi:outer membrane lipoprotein-sorting protein [Pleionea sp. CnH1-48]|uniref:outer membrane lipoprotein-sorting protein n=1 Tax=Pleionea sp. CnH1-48 TaxID=2954494 RepID=UPI0020981125|nr:outer membrane lipoprotein-sorting protein [Pleionea sp. CnH1-48]MCO7226339.1 outer membrane lipoprotein-sorting protein [Pleionea sp. CnH1-48]
MRKALAILSLVSLLPLSVVAETAEEKGLAIAQESDRRNTGWRDSKASMEMILRNQAGRESRRKIRIQSLEVEGDGDKGLTIFDEPKDVQGTAFLSFSHSIKPDEQWLYLPALKRVKRISSSNKSGPFMGSEFSYEDLSSFELEKYKFKYLRDDKVGEHDVFVLESTPQYKHSGYKRLVTYIDKAEYRSVKIEFYDRRNELMKTLVSSEYQKFLDKYWRPLNMEMTNHQTGKSTTLKWSDYEFQTGVKESNFSKSALKRLR